MKNFKVVLTIVIISIFPGCKQKQNVDSYFITQPYVDYQKLKEEFYNVPEEAKMRSWWFWMNGIATKKSIDRKSVV